MTAPNPLMVLTDSDVQSILGNLNKSEIERMQASLRSTLHEYSTGNQDQPCCHTNQKERMVIENSNGTTTLVMPARSSVGMSLKVVTLAAPQKPVGHHVGADEVQSTNTSPQGSLTLMDNDGNPYAFINAEEITAFRTALASSLLIVRRKRVKAITVFGSGKQAFWHLRLALLFHGKTVENVYINSHQLGNSSKQFFKTFVGHDPAVKKEEGWHHTKFSVLSPSYSEHLRLSKAQLRSSDIIICATPSKTPLFDETILTNPSGRIKGRLIIAVGSFKPEMIELPPALLKQAVKHHGHGRHIRKRALEGGCVLVDSTKSLGQTGELIQAELQMNHVVEIGEIVMLDEQFAHELGDSDDETAVEDTEARPSIDSSHNNSGMSSMATALNEITNTSRRGSRRSSKASTGGSDSTTPSWTSHLAFQKRRHDLNDHHKKKHSKDEEEMTEWLARGNVIYKSIGLGLMDLVVGNELVRLARDMDYGTFVSDF